MEREYSSLNAHLMKAGSNFVRPTHDLPERVKLSDPALNVMTDLKHVSVVTVRAKTPMDKAHAKMVRYGVRTLLVLDETDKVLGFLTTTDILGEKPMRFLQNHGGTHADIMVRDIMTPQRELEVLDLRDVVTAKVGHVLATLKAAGRQHALVVENNANGTQAVCGIFSATQIARQLGVQVQIAEVARTFAQIEEALADSHVLI
ncbi:MAG TPA: CBS domain-containing protein [Gallionellaceae bacterium]